MQSDAVKMRRAVKKACREQLEAYFEAETELPDGTMGTVLDDLCIRSLHGCGIMVTIHTKAPEEPDVPVN